MRLFSYADLGSFTVGFNLESWALPLYVTCTFEYQYRSVELYFLCFYISFRWTPSAPSASSSQEPT